MRRTLYLAMILTVGWVALASLGSGTRILAARPAAPAQQGDGAANAARILADARQALGGETVLAAVRSLVITGSRYSRPASCEGRLEVVVEAPDRFVQLAWWPGGLHGDECPPTPRSFSPRDLINNRSLKPWMIDFTTRTGFLGDAAFYQGPPPARDAFDRSLRLEVNDARGTSELQRLCAKYLLPLLASSLPSYPASFTFAGEQSIDGRTADIIEARGSDGFVFRLFVDRKTHLPAMLTWMAATFGQMKSPADASQAVEHKMSIEDYKRKDGVNWPRKFRTSIGERNGAIGVVEEIWGLAFKINPTLDASTFTIPK